MDESRRAKYEQKLSEARDDLDDQLGQLNSAVGAAGVHGEGVVTKHAAILQARMTRELSAALEKAAAEVTDASSQTARTLTFWTKVLAFATFALALFALGPAMESVGRLFSGGA